MLGSMWLLVYVLLGWLLCILLDYIHYMYVFVVIAEQFPNVAFSKAAGSLHYVLYKYYKQVRTVFLDGSIFHCLYWSRVTLAVTTSRI